MKITFIAATAFALIFVPSAWTAANAHGAGNHSSMHGMNMMEAESFAWGHPGKANAVDRTIHIKAEDSMRFVPDHVAVKAGSTVKFVITNVGKLTHELVLGPKSVQKAHQKEMMKMLKSGETHMKHSDPYEVELPPGTTKTLIWTFTKPGHLQYGCHEPGHYAAGMYGMITVVKN